MIDISVQEKYSIDIEFDENYYAGSYEICPTTSEQIITTAHKKMLHNLEIKPIPYHETETENGKTVVIG